MFTVIVIAALFSCASSPVDAKEIDERIVAGNLVDIEDYPYQVALMYKGEHCCGGSIISEDFIVTAASCTCLRGDSALKIRAGSSNRKIGGQVRDVAEIHRHQKYGHVISNDYDIAILRLSRSLRFGKKVKAIRLPDLDEIPPVGTECFVTGWGHLREGDLGAYKEYPIRLRGVELQLVSDKDCRRAHTDYRKITSRMICAINAKGMRDSCKGDGGGALMANGMLVGIDSWGEGCARPNVPKVFARVANRDLLYFIIGITGL